MVSRTSPTILNNSISVQEAATYSGYNRQYIRRILRSRRLYGLKLGQLWLIDKRALDIYLDNVMASKDRRFGPKK